jgi:hypothetical protein
MLGEDMFMWLLGMVSKFLGKADGKLNWFMRASSPSLSMLGNMRFKDSSWRTNGKAESLSLEPDMCRFLQSMPSSNSSVDVMPVITGVCVDVALPVL